MTRNKPKHKKIKLDVDLGEMGSPLLDQQVERRVNCLHYLGVFILVTMVVVYVICEMAHGYITERMNAEGITEEEKAAWLEWLKYTMKIQRRFASVFWIKRQ